MLNTICGIIDVHFNTFCKNSNTSKENYLIIEFIDSLKENIDSYSVNKGIPKILIKEIIELTLLCKSIDKKYG